MKGKWLDNAPEARVMCVLVVIIGLALASCASAGAGVTARRSDGATAGPATAASVPLEPVDTPAPTSDPAATEPATEPATTDAVTVPPTEAPPTTPAPARVPAGWQVVDVFPNEIFPPFDESNWTGVPSPVITDPLADGIYAAGVANRWSPDDPNELSIGVQRLLPCIELPADACVDTGSPYGPDEMGVSPQLETMLVTLDDTLRVGLTGFDCEGVDAYGNGADLAALYTDFDTAYRTTIEPSLADEVGLAARLNANPTNGFSGIGGSCGPDGFSVVFHDGDAPPLLLQVLTASAVDANGNDAGRRPLAPEDLIRLDSVQVIGGVMTLYFYAGFYS